MKKYVAISVLVLLAVAFFAGYWPEHQRRVAAEDQVGTLLQQLSDAENRVRLGNLLGQLLTLTDVVSDKNFGQAQGYSTAFFDGLLAESARSQAPFKPALDELLQVRDQVTAGLTRGDPATIDVLQRSLTRLRRALGYSVVVRSGPASPVPTPASDVTPEAPPPSPSPTPPSGS